MDENEQSSINFIPYIKWIKKGVAKNNPDRVQLSKDELVRIIRDTRDNLRISSANNDDDDGENSTSNSAGTEQRQQRDNINLDNYDEEQDVDVGQLLNINSLVDVQGEADDMFADPEDSDEEDDHIKPEDNLILVGRVEGDASVLEVHVYNEQEESLYVHHDILLSDIPLCLEWLDHEPNAPPGNYCAIGMMSPIIEVWDLDVINCLEPAYKLGKKGSRRKRIERIGHTDAVLDLSWNRKFNHVLASGSVDKTIMIWDLDEGKPSVTIKAFDDKVQTLEWHKLEAQTLLAGSSDKTARVFDCRTPENQRSWQVEGEAERVTWNPLEPYSFFVSTSTGYVQYFDIRRGEIFKVKAHEKEVTGLSVSAQCPGLFVTSSSDELVKVWDYSAGDQEPKMVHEKFFKIGEVQALGLNPDLPFVIACGGDNKEHNFTVFDLQNDDAVKIHFQNRPLIQLEAEDVNMEGEQSNE